jgi:hypothetical protein
MLAAMAAAHLGVGDRRARRPTPTGNGLMRLNGVRERGDHQERERDDDDREEDLADAAR